MTRVNCHCTELGSMQWR